MKEKGKGVGMGRPPHEDVGGKFFFELKMVLTIGGGRSADPVAFAKKYLNT
jgi:hypothetical protein